LILEDINKYNDIVRELGLHSMDDYLSKVKVSKLFLRLADEIEKVEDIEDLLDCRELIDYFIRRISLYQWSTHYNPIRLKIIEQLNYEKNNLTIKLK